MFISGAASINVGSPKSRKLSGGNTTISMIKPSSIRRTASAMARQMESPGRAHIVGDRWLQVGVGHNATDATKSFGAKSFFNP